MSSENIIRAWKDDEYRLSLTEVERAELPVHPLGPVELQDVALDGAAGGWIPHSDYCTHHPFSACC